MSVSCPFSWVFPMHVGVFLPVLLYRAWCSGLPHARGGVSGLAVSLTYGQRSSPCTWGCFQPSDTADVYVMVFPMHVGVFPSAVIWYGSTPGLPHARGGVSAAARYGATDPMSSPCTWGCFFCTERSKQSRRSLPHARGGVSSALSAANRAVEVFPMHVGVFPVRGAYQLDSGRLPHARGGVSISTAVYQITTASSPCTWGCFYRMLFLPIPHAVSPMHVGVFPLP